MQQTSFISRKRVKGTKSPLFVAISPVCPTSSDIQPKGNGPAGSSLLCRGAVDAFFMTDNAFCESLTEKELCNGRWLRTCRTFGFVITPELNHAHTAAPTAAVPQFFIFYFLSTSVATPEKGFLYNTYPPPYGSCLPILLREGRSTLFPKSITRTSAFHLNTRNGSERNFT